MKFLYNWLGEYLEKIPSSEELSSQLTMIGLEVEEVIALENGDFVFEVNITPNRADCLSLMGIAREVAAVNKQRVLWPETLVDVLQEFSSGLPDHKISVGIDDTNLCLKYACLPIGGVKIEPSPEWLASRLEKIGIRSINNIVDITNYVLLETGHPLHAFDYDLISGEKIFIRRARSGERFLALNNQEYVLDSETLVVADNQKCLAMGGVIGGLTSGVNPQTKNILLESAYFQPLIIRKASRKFSLPTESAIRFGRGVDYNGNVLALRRCAFLINKLTQGKINENLINFQSSSSERNPLEIRVSRANKILGLTIGKEEIKNILTDLNLNIVKEEGEEGVWVCPPSYRQDINQEIDLIEEIARLKGYDQIKATLPEVIFNRESGLTENQILVKKIKDIVAGLGLKEVINYSFINPSHMQRLFPFREEDLKNFVTLKNPINEDLSILRPSLLPGLLKNVSLNIRMNNNVLEIFEVGKVFADQNNRTFLDVVLKRAKESQGGDFNERIHLAIVLSELKHIDIWDKTPQRDFFCLKGILENLLTGLGEENPKNLELRKVTDIVFLAEGKGYSLWFGGKAVGYIGVLSEAAGQSYDLKGKYLVMEIDLFNLNKILFNKKKYKSIGKYPAVYRDLAVLVDNITKIKDIYGLLDSINRKPLKEYSLFDLYEGKSLPPGKKSLCFSFIYQNDERTLTDEEVDQFQMQILSVLNQNFGAELRK